MTEASARRDLKIAVIPGDGIGKEVVPEAVKILEAAAMIDSKISFSFTEFPWNCDYFLEHGQMMPDDGLEQLANFDQILLGAIGAPSVPDHVSLWGLLIPIRRFFQQFVNVRPVRLMPGIVSPLANREPGSIDMVVVRENSEGEYSEIGGRIHSGTDAETAIQVDYFSRMGVERIMRFAFELAMTRKRRLTVATKSNGIVHSMPFWDQVAREMNEHYPEVSMEFALVDALAARFVTHPQTLDVVVGSNLFADILTDIGGAIAPAANLDPSRLHPSMFEPVHGSAPDIAGSGIANPMAQIWTAAMMLDFIGCNAAAAGVVRAIEATLIDGVKTADLGGSATTAEVTARVLAHLEGDG
jgi:tartrate dehydrogenase/decarboxylase/D-malate dehydrogenase